MSKSIGALRHKKVGLSSFLHGLINTLFVIAILAIVMITGSWQVAVFLVLISKWRILAVQPRYWFANIKSNLVDIIIGVSFTLLIYHAGQVGSSAISGGLMSTVNWTVVAAQLGLGALYSVYLLVIKSKSSEFWVATQAAAAVFLGSMAAVMSLGTLPSVWLVAAMFVIGYGAARHIMLLGDGEPAGGLDIIFGLLLAETTWLCYHWLIAYTIPGTGLKLPQLTIIATLISFLAHKLRLAWQKDGKFKLSEVGAPILFVAIVVFAVLTWFSNPTVSI